MVGLDGYRVRKSRMQSPDFGSFMKILFGAFKTFIIIIIIYFSLPGTGILTSLQSSIYLSMPE